MSGLTRSDLREYVRSHLFSPGAAEDRQTRFIGAELELIPVRSDSGQRVFTDGDEGTVHLLRSAARANGWTEIPGEPDPPRFETRRGESITFEPGGQVEISGPPLNSASELIELMRETASVIQDAASRAGITFKAIGFDSYTPLSDVPLQLTRPRYQRMTEYFHSIGGSGVEMMRQTASLQINVERGPEPETRWRLLNAMIPFLIAIFANSPRTVGGVRHRSYRSHIWRTLDSRRSGMQWGLPPADAYFEFAMAAPVILGGSENSFPSFDEWLNAGSPTMEDWVTHLSTLFPEVRPREYFEIRSIDALPLALLAAPIVFVAGLVYDRDASRRAGELIGDPRAEILELSGRDGLRDARIGEAAAQLFLLALEGAEALGENYVAPSDLLEARKFLDEYTAMGRSPADNVRQETNDEL